MKMLVALFDRAVEGYAPIMTVNTRGEALRSFKDAMEDKNSPLSKHPSDYELWQLGIYNDETGIISGDMERIARGEDYAS